MSRALPKPWIKNMVLALLTPANTDAQDDYLIHADRHAVQVLSCNENLRTLVISDKEHSIGVMLTRECFVTLRSQKPFKELPNCIINLHRGGYHITGVFSSIGDRGLPDLGAAGVTLPLALQCHRCDFYADSSLEVVGDPHDANADRDVRAIVGTMQYVDLVGRLVAGQMPKELNLPDSEGRFRQPPAFSSGRIPFGPQVRRPSSIEQERLLQDIDTFERIKVC